MSYVRVNGGRETEQDILGEPASETVECAEVGKVG